MVGTQCGCEHDCCEDGLVVDRVPIYRTGIGDRVGIHFGQLSLGIWMDESQSTYYDHVNNTLNTARTANMLLVFGLL